MLFVDTYHTALAGHPFSRGGLMCFLGGFYGEHFSEIIKILDQRFRCQCLFENSLSIALAAHMFGRAGPFVQ